jgi:glycosyltransferase involved in cell wall biosynthesis
MQIEVIDDASTVDDPEPLVRRIGGDRVGFFRQPRNLGLVGSWNGCIERARGEWVHVLHSDDVVFPGFYAAFQTALAGRDDVGAAFCRWRIVDENDRELWTSELEQPAAGPLRGFLDRIGRSQRISTPSMVVRRSVYERRGGFRAELSSAADWEMWVRVAAHYPIWYEPRILAAWRVHPQSKTELVVRSAENVPDNLRCLATIRPYFPVERARRMTRAAREQISLGALLCASMAGSEGEYSLALRQVRDAVGCCFSLRVLKSLLLLPFSIAQGNVRRTRSER